VASRSRRKALARAEPAALPTLLLVVPAAGGPALERALAGQGWPVVSAPDARAAGRAAAQVPPDVVIVPEQDSRRATLALLRRLERAAPGVRPLVLLGATRGAARAEALLAYASEGGAPHLLPPPVTPRRLVQAVRRVWSRQQDERVALLNVAGHGQALAELRALMEQRTEELSRTNRELRRALREIAQKNKALTTLNESLRIQSTTDPLTSLYNRREFLNRIRTEWGRFKRYGRPLSLIMLDIDHFKRINDTYGHECGDVVLRSLGHLISRHKRAQDLCCRYGGEEFMVLLTETTLDTAFHVAEGLRTLIAEYPFSYDGQPIDVRVSLGCSGAAEQDPADVEAFINLSDKAMYRAKREGRDRTVVLDGVDESRIARQTEAGTPVRPPRESRPRRRRRSKA
jgi:diguanylate cyclase (GGDEF)-like protein